MKKLFLLFFMFVVGCAIKPNYYEVDSYISIPPVDEVWVDGKKVERYEKNATLVDVDTSFFNREISLIKDGKSVSTFTLKSDYINKRGAVMTSRKGDFIIYNAERDTISPVF